MIKTISFFDEIIYRAFSDAEKFAKLLHQVVINNIFPTNEKLFSLVH